jgi:outer membrane protein TolC
MRRIFTAATLATLCLRGQSIELHTDPPAAQGALPLTLKRAVEIALTPEGSPRVALAMESIHEAEARKTEARGALLPDLESSVNAQRQTTNLKAFGFGPQAFSFIPAGITFPTVVGPFSVIDARATVSQSVFDYSSIKRYQQSKVNLDAVKTDFDVTQNQVTDQVARAYLATLSAQAALETAQANVELSQALRNLAEQQKEAGTGTGLDVTRADVQLANDKQRLVVAENDRRRAGLNLLRAMGLKLDAEVVLSDKLEYKPAEIGAIESALADARKTRAELKAQREREQAANLNYTATRAERYPSLSVSANYGAIGADATSAAPTYLYGATLRVPLFDGGRRDARRAESLSQYRQEQTRTHDLDQQVELDVRLAFDSIHAGAVEVETAQGALALSDQELAQAKRRYQAGVANSLEVTDAQTRLIRSRDNLIKALYDYNVARIDLATATGRIREYVNQ